jgi:type VI secretion system protein ImpM
MTRQRGAFAGQPTGYYGKLPARADFVGRRLARPIIERWDSWLQQCLARSQAVLAASWQSLYLTAPAWRFALPAGTCGTSALIGVLVPSADAVGRCFPLLLAQELPETADTVAIAIGATPWFEAVEILALDALDGAFDLAALDRKLPILAYPSLPNGANGATTAHPIGLWIGLPMLSALGTVLRGATGIGKQPALWWTGGGGGFSPCVAITAGLVAPAGFAALLDGAWTRHGWDSATDRTGTHTEQAWDRDA